MKKAKASIDIGSNTALLLVAILSDDKIEEQFNFSTVTALGKNLDKNGSFDIQSMEDTFQALKKYKSIIEEHKIKVEDVIVTATEASRVASNAETFYKTVFEKLGFKVSVISGAGEAHYTAKGVSLSVGEDDFFIMDIGGASTELIKVKKNPFKILESISVPVGAVRVNDWILENKHVNKMSTAFSAFNLLPFTTKNLVSVAGTMTSIAAIDLKLHEFVEKRINHHVVEKKTLQYIYQELNELGEKKIRMRYPFLGKRSKTITSGSWIALEVGKRLNVEQYIISTYGLRHGTLVSGLLEDRFVVKRFF